MSVDESQRHGEREQEPLAPVNGWKPATRRAFLGRLAPAYYDHATLHDVYGKAVPNTIIENAVGLMLSYDELWFLQRSDCPANMQDLDFVKFVSDDASLLQTAEEAYEHGLAELAVIDGLFGEDGKNIPLDSLEGSFFTHAGSQAKRMIVSLEMAIHIRDSMAEAGYQCDPSGRPGPGGKPRDTSHRTQMAEWLVADSLGLGPMDYIVNIMNVLPGSSSPDGGRGLETHQIEALEAVLHLKSTDALTPQGPYQDYIGDLRKDKRIRGLRDFLAGKPSPDGTAAALACEAERMIDTYLEEGLRKHHRPVLLRTIGTMSLGALGNALLPGSGSLANLLNADRMVSDFKFKRDSRWALFVIDARKHLSSLNKQD